ncbi:MAG: fumarate hydratase, partial [Xanthobacteraceae bacterium]|nr:fumarate hydratase [Xanthobacteraceae bacterium]
MAVTYEMVKSTAAELYGSCLKKIPEDTKDALRKAHDAETHDGAKKILALMLRSAQSAETTDRHVCSDAGVPVYFIKIGTAARLEGDIRKAISDGFDYLVATIDPPILKHVTNPLTRERGYRGKDMPIVSFDLVDGADYVEITCSPKALGSGRWAALEIFSFPELEVIEKYVMDCVLKAGSQHCPPVVIGVGIGGTFEYCAKLASLATLRPYGQHNPEPVIADMEQRLLQAVNKTGFGPMGTGGDTTALAVNI